MTAPDRLLADIVAERALTTVEARDLVDSIRTDVADLGERIGVAYLGQSWIALGYANWDALCEAEFDGARLRVPRERRVEQVQSLRAAGLSTRAIGSALGIGNKTVARDLATVSDDTVESVRSLDGRTRPAVQPPRSSPAPQPAASVAAQPSSSDAGEPTREQFLAQRDTGEVLSPADWQAQNADRQAQNAELDRSLDAQLSETDDRYLLNLARAIVGCQPLLNLAPHRAVETYQPDSDEAVVLAAFLDRMDTWTREVRAGIRPSLRSVR